MSIEADIDDIRERVIKIEDGLKRFANDFGDGDIAFVEGRARTAESQLAFWKKAHEENHAFLLELADALGIRDGGGLTKDAYLNAARKREKGK